MANIFGFGLFLPLYGVYIAQLGQSPENGSFVWAAHTLLTGLIVLFIGRIEDKQSRGYQKALIAGNSLQVLGVLFFLASTNFHIFIAGLLVYSIGTAILAPSWFSSFASSIPKKHSAKGWSISQAGSAFAGAAGAASGGIVYSSYGFGGVFACALVFHGIGLLFSVAATRARRS